MASTVGVNKLSIVNEDSSGTSIAFPDVCQTPAPPAPPIPIPYPNIAMSSDTAKGTKKVTAQGKPICVEDSNFSKSSGDEAGTAGGGVASSKFQGKAEFMNYSMDVQFEGKNVPRSFDLMLHNDKNTPPFPVLQGPIIALGSSASAPAAADTPAKSAPCDWCLVKVPQLGTKLKAGASGADVKKIHEHLKQFGFKVELSEWKNGKWQESDEISKGSWGPATQRAVRMFALHPKVKNDDELVFGTNGEALTNNFAKKLNDWCAKKIESPQNYWEYQDLEIGNGDLDALGSHKDPKKQTVMHDFIVQIETDLAKTGFALHKDDLCGLKKDPNPKGAFVPAPPDAKGRHPDKELADVPHLVAKFQRQAKWLWRTKKDGSAADDVTDKDDSYYPGEVSGQIDAATVKVLHHWASHDLHMVFKRFALTDLHWPPDSGTAIKNTDGASAQLRKDAADAWLKAAKDIERLGATLGGEYASSPRPWKNGKMSNAGGTNSAFSWHYSGLAIDIDQAFLASDGTISDRFRYGLQIEGDRFRLWCWVDKQPAKPAEVQDDKVDALLQYRNRNIKTKHPAGSTGEKKNVKTDSFDPTPLYFATNKTNEAGTSVDQVSAKEGWYVDVTAILEANGLMRIPRHRDWLSKAKAWEWWHYQFQPPLPPGAESLSFGDYLQIYGVHEYQLRSVSDGWPAHEDIDHEPG